MVTDAGYGFSKIHGILKSEPECPNDADIGEQATNVLPPLSRQRVPRWTPGSGEWMVGPTIHGLGAILTGAFSGVDRALRLTEVSSLSWPEGIGARLVLPESYLYDCDSTPCSCCLRHP